MGNGEVGERKGVSAPGVGKHMQLEKTLTYPDTTRGMCTKPCLAVVDPLNAIIYYYYYYYKSSK